MFRIIRRIALGSGVGVGVGLLNPLWADQPPMAVQPGQPLRITVSTTQPPPKVSIALGSRSGKVTPLRSGCTHTGGGNISVDQPSPDTLVVTMTGAAVAYGGPTGSASASQVFDLVQQFEVSFDAPEVKSAKLTLEGRLIGFLRRDKAGTAEVCAGAVVTGGMGPGLALAMPGHSVSEGESISINDFEPVPGVVVGVGKYTLSESFKITATMPKCIFPCKAPSAEFAPDPALDPLWISPKDPFKGAKKNDLGYQVTLRISPEEVPLKK